MQILSVKSFLQRTDLQSKNLITQKLRDTAHRVNDVGRLGSYALENGVSTTNIPSNEENVNTINSIPENKSDAEYLNAVESGDMETLKGK